MSTCLVRSLCFRQVRSNPIRFDHIDFYSVWSCLILFVPILSGSVRFGLVKSSPDQSGPIRSNTFRPAVASSGVVHSSPMGSDSFLFCPVLSILVRSFNYFVTIRNTNSEIRLGTLFLQLSKWFFKAYAHFFENFSVIIYIYFIVKKIFFKQFTNLI